MAKRKRLTPPEAAYLDTGPAPETKSMFASPAPIAGVAREASSAAALDEMTETYRRARIEGRMVMSLPLELVKLDYLVRDRVSVDEGEMEVLVDSLRARGQQTPIEVADLGVDARPRYGLISGWRRCQALMRISDQTGIPPQVLALLRRPDQASDAYLAMVEENEIRVGLSYYERARIVARAAEQGVYADEKTALAALFASASRAKRSKIGSFLGIVAALDGALAFPEALGERAGLALARGLEDHPALGPALRATLAGAAPATAEAEQALIAEALKSPPEEARQGMMRAEIPAPSGPAEASGAVSQSAPPAGAQEVAPGLWMRAAANGELRIGGAGLTPALRAALQDWLARQV